MQTFDEWKSWYEAHAEPADPIEGGVALLRDGAWVLLLQGIPRRGAVH